MSTEEANKGRRADEERTGLGAETQAQEKAAADLAQLRKNDRRMAKKAAKAAKRKKAQSALPASSNGSDSLEQACASSKGQPIKRSQMSEEDLKIACEPIRDILIRANEGEDLGEELSNEMKLWYSKIKGFGRAWPVARRCWIHVMHKGAVPSCLSAIRILGSTDKRHFLPLWLAECYERSLSLHSHYSNAQLESHQQAAEQLVADLVSMRITALQEALQGKFAILLSSSDLVKVLAAFRAPIPLKHFGSYVEALNQVIERCTEKANENWGKARKNRRFVSAVVELTSILLHIQSFRSVVDLPLLARTGTLLNVNMTSLAKIDQDAARAAVQTAFSNDNVFRANEIMNECQLRGEFPEIVKVVRTKSLKRAIKYERYSEVLNRLERYSDKEINKVVINELSCTGKPWLAQTLAVRAGEPINSPMFKDLDMDLLRQQEQEYTAATLPFELDLEDVVFVCDTESAHLLVYSLEALGTNASVVDVVGLDAEWKAVLSKGAESPVSIIQIGLRDKVYIVDLIWVHEGATPERLQVLQGLHQLFKREDVIKVGFDFEGDMKMLQKSYPKTKAFAEINAVVDFAKFELRPRAAGEDGNPWEVVPVRKHYHGLKSVINLLFGKSLCKIEQMSDWESRPLREDQIRYAANDAHVLVRAYDAVFGGPYPVAPLCIFGMGTKKPKSLHFKAGKELERSLAVEHAAPKTQHEENAEEITRNVTKRLKSRCNDKGAQFMVVQSFDKVPPICDVALLRVDQSNASVKAVAQQLDQPLAHVLKSIAFLVLGQPVLVMVRGDATAKLVSLAKELGVSKHEITQTSPSECISRFGMAPGALGPFIPEGHTVRVVMDAEVLKLSNVFCGAGSLQHVVFARSTSAVVMDAEVLKLSNVFCGAGSLQHVVFARSTSALRNITHASVHSFSKVKQVEDAESKPVVVQPNVSDSKEAPKFLVDRMLLGVGKRLRIAGQDCLLCDDIVEPDKSSNFSIQKLNQEQRAMEKRRRIDIRQQELEKLISAARRLNRVLLTTDHKAISFLHTGVQVCMLDNRSDSATQFLSVRERFNLHLDKSDLLSRCVKCNSKSFESVSKSTLRELKARGELSETQLPEGVLARVDTFFRCGAPACLHVYWQGPKFA
eukprot:CAMPEP_0184561078 /NCGR_PEP_ID=MMETSP0199_2-20130426/47255_1 /TAXON_ID=1112570 /ORGANISM="Thraustochytrium sp., Strain LLF1b" /LENGTH=1122 /DNA_ID=CAMNT_0026958389 /DNA_START=100 /DNA_END=3465 /DNA_ORIENTATION=-